VTAEVGADGDVDGRRLRRVGVPWDDNMLHWVGTIAGWCLWTMLSVRCCCSGGRDGVNDVDREGLSCVCGSAQRRDNDATPRQMGFIYFFMTSLPVFFYYSEVAPDSPLGS
jgi:hypothetical protein